MAGFTDIIGHEQIIAHLKNAISREKISHAYILDGPERSGKMMLAEAFAAALQCENEQNRGCGTCRSCKQAANRNHPDILYVTHDKPNVISVSDIRQQVNASVVIRPYNQTSRYKVYIIDEAEKMNEQAQNALLKTIEEPPDYAVILLLTTNASAFLPTIRSRCVTLELKAVPDESIRRLLMQKYGVVDYKAKVCVAFAQGNVGKAITLAESRSFNDLKDETSRLVRSIRDTQVHDLMREVKTIEELKQNEDFFDLLTMWYRDVLLCKAADTRDKLIFQDQIHETQRQAEEYSYEGLNNILEAIETARRRIRANVNADMTLELLLLAIKENQT